MKRGRAGAVDADRSRAPGELLRRRPDVADAESRLHAFTARFGVATADMFAPFALGGLLGGQAIVSGDLFERSSGGATRRASRSSASVGCEHTSSELARYRQSVLLAI